VTINDLQKAVQRTAALFTAPFLEFLAVLILLWYLAGVNPPAFLLDRVGSFWRDVPSSTRELLHDTRMLALAPIVAAFLFLLLLILLRNTVRSVAQALPPQVALHRSALVARLATPAHTMALWKQLPELSLEDVVATVDARLNEIVAEASARDVDDLRYWRERAAYFMRGFDAFKVLTYVAVACAVYALIRGSSIGGTTTRFLIATSALLAGAIVSLILSLQSSFQEVACAARPWAGSDEIWRAGIDVEIAQERLDEYRAMALGRWWSFRLTKAAAVAEYWHILRGGAA
jgi:hypothetical protein